MPPPPPPRSSTRRRTPRRAAAASQNTAPRPATGTTAARRRKTASTRRSTAAKRGAATRTRSRAAAQRRRTTAASPRTANTRANQTKTPVEVVGAYAERAVLIPVGVALEARDRVAGRDHRRERARRSGPGPRPERRLTTDRLPRPATRRGAGSGKDCRPTYLAGSVGPSPPSAAGAPQKGVPVVI